MWFNKISFVICTLISASTVLGSTCIWDTAQCGGKNYTGLKNCCSSKSVCTKINDYYSKCMPGTSSCSNKLDSQCGGKDFKGNTCCPSGLKCTFRNEWFSKCMSGAPTPTTSPSCSNKLDSQCGGKDYKGNACCPSGLKCTYRNEWFSKCMSSSTTPSPTPKATTSSCSNRTDSQCGGKTFTGQTCCPSPLKCTYRNEWFSKCMAPSTPSPSPTTTKPATSAPTALVCDNSSKFPCGHSSSGGVSFPDAYCCAVGEECVDILSSSGTGSLCESIIRPKTCDPNPCLNGSSCYTGGSGTHCTCINNYSGLFCETPKCTAPEVPCGRASWGYGSSPDNKCCTATQDCISSSSPGGTAWECAPKDRPMTCDPSPCLNGSTCYYGSGGPYCQCVSGHNTGLFCEKTG